MTETPKLPLGLLPANLTALREELANLVARAKSTSRSTQDCREDLQEPMLVIRGK